jgi:heat-inducible transcriptional repressor
MDSRKELILNTIIREHIKTGSPVGSGILVDKYKLDISPATVRNEMMELEEEGYIRQPHTSAGRVPTEKAYNLYIENLKDKKLSESDEKILAKALSGEDEAGFKNAAKAIAELSDSAVFWAIHRHNLYYTGISNLFKQPEFSQADLICDVSAVIDSIDEIIDKIFDDVNDDVVIMLGSENPFGNFCSTIITKYKKGNNTGLFGIIAPMRMNYEKNLAVMKFVKNLL